MTNLPLFRRSRVFHVGTLNPGDKGRQGRSLEGHGLSVSLHPEDWSRIARLGAGAVHVLARRGGAFLDYHRFRRQAVLVEALLAWGERGGWLRPSRRYRLEWTDGESDEPVQMLCRTRREANTEFRHLAESDDTATLATVEVPCGTARLARRVGFAIDDALALDLAAPCWIEDTTTLDGVWWTDTLDPAALSAPRGVIVPRRLAAWTVRPR